MNVGIPPRSLNHRLPAAEDAPTANAASSLLEPFAISRQNKRPTSRRNDGFPGDFIGALPVNSLIHPAGLPIETSTIEVLRGPVESSESRSAAGRSAVGEQPQFGEEEHVGLHELAFTVGLTSNDGDHGHRQPVALAKALQCVGDVDELRLRRQAVGRAAVEWVARLERRLAMAVVAKAA